MIVIDKLCKEYHLGKSTVLALDSVSLTIEKERFAAFTGDSGSGKSTLFHLLGGFDKPTSGRISVGGRELSSLDDAAMCRYRNSTIGFVFQSFHLEPTYTVYKNVELPLIIAGVPRHARIEKVGRALQTVGMYDKRSHSSADLSGGERQRVSIARAIINDPEYILADEPCGNLDSANSRSIMDTLCRLAERAATVLLITHNMADAHMAERLITLSDGAVVSDENK
ncbi:MAG: ABC transporter ATP-binding protein [Clostridiales Family XIII bacterium]|jgi:putative ABC transport system ATP-binding protein|nr:ABC transporter ATP-binding protein [Clostridiales Family XIII bacterium]